MASSFGAETTTPEILQQLYPDGGLREAVQLTVADGVVYARLLLDRDATTIAAWRARDEHELWRLTTPGPIGNLRGHMLVVANGTLFLAPDQHRVIAYRVEDRQRLWDVTLDPDVGLWTNLVAAGGVVYVETAEGQVRALDGHTGAMCWRISLPAGDL